MDENAKVTDLRSEIDRIDEQILSLIERRLELAGRMAHAKAAVNQHSPLRPDRERYILETLKKKAQRASHTLVEIVWREVIGQCRQLQGPLRLVLSTGQDRNLFEECARRQFGSAMPWEYVETSDEAFEIARRLPAIAVVEREERAKDLVQFEDVRTLNGTVLGYAYARIDAKENS